MNLYLVHCGFYDPEICEGIFEFHTNFFVVAQDFENARLNVKNIPEFKLKRMHIDGVQQITAVLGYRVILLEVAELNGKSVVKNHNFRELAQLKGTTKPSNF